MIFQCTRDENCRLCSLMESPYTHAQGLGVSNCLKVGDGRCGKNWEWDLAVGFWHLAMAVIKGPTVKFGAESWDPQYPPEPKFRVLGWKQSAEHPHSFTTEDVACKKGVLEDMEKLGVGFWSWWPALAVIMGLDVTPAVATQAWIWGLVVKVFHWVPTVLYHCCPECVAICHTGAASTPIPSKASPPQTRWRPEHRSGLLCNCLLCTGVASVMNPRKQTHPKLAAVPSASQGCCVAIHWA